MKDYSKGKIYWIKSNQTDLVYIGSTIAELDERFIQHKYLKKNYEIGRDTYCSSFELLEKYNDCYIELIENYPCNNKNELCKREGKIQREYENRVNIEIAGRTNKQYRNDNIEKITQYRIDNKEKAKEYQKEYRICHREKAKQYKKQYYLKKKAEKELIKHLEIISLL